MQTNPTPKPKTVREILTVESITELLAEKKIKERECTDSSGCNSCYFNSTCRVTKNLPCMGRNREDKKSIYYAGVK